MHFRATARDLCISQSVAGGAEDGYIRAADFGDLLLENIRIFREHPDVLRQYQQRFRFILVDEYQDTNVAQYLLAAAVVAGAVQPSCAPSFRSEAEEPNPESGNEGIASRFRVCAFGASRR